MGRALPFTNGSNITRKCISASLAASVHIAALTLALYFISAPAASNRPSLNLATFDIPAPGPSSATPPTPPQPKKIPPQPPQEIVLPPPLIEVPTLSPLVVSMLKQSEAQSSAGGCDLTAPVQAALRESKPVQNELITIPDARRSVANAIAIWDQAWVEPDAQLQPTALDTIRSTVAMTVEAASENCRLQPQGGPRFIYLPGTKETTILALGSGEWSWQQVADTARSELAINSESNSHDRSFHIGGTSLNAFMGRIFNPGASSGPERISKALIK